jgi:uncharacterized protein with HEPN domain
MTRHVRERLSDIRDALRFIEQHVGGSLSEPAIDAPVTLQAVLFNLMVIGEAVKSLGADLRSEAPEIRWSDYAGLRDVITHQYFRLNPEIIEDTVRRDLPALRATVDRLLGYLFASVRISPGSVSRRSRRQ